MTEKNLVSTGSLSGASLPHEEEKKYRILLVDDEPNYLRASKRVLRQDANSYIIDTATSGLEALSMMANEVYHLVISDNKMPGMSGVDLLAQIRERFPDTIRIMLTGDTDTRAVMGAVKEGVVYRFIRKPVNHGDLRVTVDLALEQYDLIQKNKRLQHELSSQTNEYRALAKLSFSNRSRLGEILHSCGLLTASQMKELELLRKNRRSSVLKLLLERGWVSETAIFDALKKETLAKAVDLPPFQIDPQVTKLIPGQLCERQLVMPLKMMGKRTLLLALADPTDHELIEDFRFISGLDIEPVLVKATDIESKIAAVYGESSELEPLQHLVTEMSSNIVSSGPIEVVIEEDENIALENVLSRTKEPTIISLLNTVIIEAVRLNASDIHIQPRERDVIVRYRIDGVLVDKIEVPNVFLSALVSRIKVLADLDIADRRRPQDGRITIKTPLKIVDLRISVIPTINGEKVVMRLLDRNAAILKLSELGFSEINLQRILNLVSIPQGIILTTGPTGSGKTTTLHSLLQHKASNQKNYVTIEDPVEYHMDMATQVNVHNKIGLGFANVLRAMLRQDPDVMLIGEIRDLETAEVAFHAALSGHQVYSTLHANSAADTVSRLMDLGLKPYIIASALTGVVSQRLVRKICDKCRIPDNPDPDVLHRLGPHFSSGNISFFRGQGCGNCGRSGYKGRIAVHELLILTEEVNELVAEGRGTADIQKASRKLNVPSLIEDARDKVHAGLTTVDEIHRVLGSQIMM